MKVLLILMLVASAMAQSQNTEFVDHLLRLQYMSLSYYDNMIATFNDARRSITSHLVDLNEETLFEVTEGLRIIIEISNVAQSLIDGATGSEECVATSSAAWQMGVENVGRMIAGCAELVAVPINNATSNIQAFLVEQSRVAFDAQNLVLAALAEVNTITDESEISPFISNQTEVISSWFFNEAVPELYRLLDVFTTLATAAATDVHDCVNAANDRLNDDSMVLRNTLDFC